MAFNNEARTPTPALAPPPAPPIASGVATDDDVAADDEQDGPAVVVGHQGRAVPPDAISSIKNDARARERRRVLLAEYGTIDENEIAKIKEGWSATKAEYERLKKERQEADTASLSEVERLKLQNAELLAKIEALTTEKAELVVKTKVERQDRNITQLAAKYVDDGGVEYAKYQLTRHIRELTADVRKRVDDKYLTRWFAKFVADNPKFAKEDLEAKARAEAARLAAVKAAAAKAKAKAAAAAEAAKTATPVAPTAPARALQGPQGASLQQRAPAVTMRQQTSPARAPIQQVPTARVAAVGGVNKPGMANGKTTRPGQPNSMTAKELREYRASIGL